MYPGSIAHTVFEYAHRQHKVRIAGPYSSRILHKNRESDGSDSSLGAGSLWVRLGTRKAALARRYGGTSVPRGELARQLAGDRIVRWDGKGGYSHAVLRWRSSISIR
jgi:hypothetical protein